MYGIKKLTFKTEYRCFQEGALIEFQPGVNFIVGDQGTGKSTIFQEIKEASVKGKSDTLSLKVDPIQVFAFDFEKDNHRTASYFEQNVSMMFQVSIRFMSHGEYAKTVLHQLAAHNKALILMDEPDTALSPRTCFNLGRMFQWLVDERQCQIIVTAHNPLLFLSQPEVFNLENMCWISGAEFLAAHLTEPGDVEWTQDIFTNDPPPHTPMTKSTKKRHGRSKK